MRRSRASVILPLLVTVALAGCGVDHEERSEAVDAVAREAVDALTEPAFADQVYQDPDRIADVAEHTVPAVVHIASERKVVVPPQLRMFMQHPGGDQIQRGAGSGVIVDAAGIILTNNHVIDGAEGLVVTLSDGRKFDAKVRGADPATDLAIVELEGQIPGDLPVMRFGDSRATRLGEVVLAIGSPFELQGTVTMGILSARGRTGMGLAAYENFLQTDAAINPGNSGGALVNLQGELIGINTAIGSRSGGYDGIGFAIPSNLARDIIDRLLADGKVVRGFLGVLPEDIAPKYADMLGLTEARGALIGQVTQDSAADRAGLEPYDVIVRVDGEDIDDANDLRNTIALKGADAEVRLDVLRNGKPRTLTATLGNLAAEVQTDRPAEPKVQEGLLGGVRLAPLDDGLRQRLRIAPDTLRSGVVITGVAPGSEAGDAGLQPGDVIVEVNREEVREPTDVARMLDGADRAMLLIQRGGYRQVVFLG